MTVQYNIGVVVLRPEDEKMVEARLRPYSVFVDGSGNLKDTAFGREDIPYIGPVVLVKTLNLEAAQTAYAVLSAFEGFRVLPITECSWEDDLLRVQAIRSRRSEDIFALETTRRVDLSDRVLPIPGK